MRELVKVSFLTICMSGLVLAQRGGGSHGGGGGFHSSGGGFHSSGSAGGYNRSIYNGTSSYHMSPFASGETGINRPGVTYPTPLGLQPSYSGASGIAYGAYGNGALRYGGGRPVYRPPIRGAGGFRNYGYYPGLLYSPYLGFGYGDYGYDPYYDSSSAGYAPPDQYYGQYPDDPGMMQGAPAPYPNPYLAYPPIPYQMDPQQQQPLPPQPSSSAPSAPIVLVLKNGQRVEVQNYAIMNGVLWDFTKQNPHRIPLSSIDEAASAKATEDEGGAFPEESFGAGPR